MGGGFSGGSLRRARSPSTSTSTVTLIRCFLMLLPTVARRVYTHFTYLNATHKYLHPWRTVARTASNDGRTCGAGGRERGGRLTSCIRPQWISVRPAADLCGRAFQLEAVFPARKARARCPHSRGGHENPWVLTTQMERPGTEQTLRSPARPRCPLTHHTLNIPGPWP